MSAYFVTPSYNGLRLFDGHPDLRICPACGAYLNADELEPVQTEKPAGSPQLSLTIDEYYIASPTFRRRYEAEGFEGLSFTPLANGYFRVEPERRVATYEVYFPEWHSLTAKAFPVEGPTLLYAEPPCPTCHRPGFLRMDGLPMPGREEPPIGPYEIVRTDKTYGDGRFYMMVGDAWRAAALRKKITGTSFYVPVEWSDRPSNTMEDILATAPPHG